MKTNNFLEDPADHTTGLRVSWHNLMCKTPTPHYNIKTEQLFQFWELPKTVRLSNRMIDAGKCGVAVAKYNERALEKMDPSGCFCGDILWVPVMAVVALGVGLASLIHFIGGMASKNRGRVFTAVDFRGWMVSEMFQFFLFTAVMVCCSIYGNNEFTYTQYGQIFPNDYFDIQPTTWRAAFWLYVVANWLPGCFFWILLIYYNTCSKDAGIKKPVEKATKQIQPKQVQKPTSIMKPIDITEVIVQIDVQAEKMDDPGKETQSTLSETSECANFACRSIVDSDSDGTAPPTVFESQASEAKKSDVAVVVKEMERVENDMERIEETNVSKDENQDKQGEKKEDVKKE